MESSSRGLYAAQAGRDERTAWLLSAAIEQAGEGIVIADCSGVIEYANPVFEQMAGFEPGKAAGRPIRSIPTEYRNEVQFREMMRAVSDGQVWTGRWILRPAGSRARTVDATVSPLRDERGQVIGFVGVHHDVTHELDLADKLRRAQKMEAVGRLAGGVAHDFNNLLTAIMGNTQILSMQLGESPACHAKVNQILTAAKRAARLTGKLLSFAQLGTSLHMAVDLHELIADVVHRHCRQAGGVQVSLELMADPSVTLGDPQHLRDALVNIAANACEAMPAGGALLFATENVTVEPLSATADELELLPGRYVRLAVHDTGRGMDSDTLAHLFEPFFTTKADAEGAGLGLASVYGCVKSHGGGIRIESRPGEGTCVELLLPAGQPVDFEPAEAGEGAAEAGGGTIMVVDDEESVREMVEDALSEFGYRVHAFGSGIEAVEFYQQHHAEVDLVMLDLIMPRMDGRQTFQKLRQINPSVRALISTGYSTSEMASRVLADGVLDFLAKPYRLGELADMVEKYVRAD